MRTPDTANAFIRNFIHAVFKRKGILITLLIVAFFSFIYLTFIVEPTFQASSEILIKLGPENVYLPASRETGPIISTNSLEQINSEIEMLNNRELGQSVISSFGLSMIYPDLLTSDSTWLSKAKKFLKQHIKQQKSLSPEEEAILKFQKALKVEGIKNSRIILISFEHKNPQVAAEAVNRLVESYLDHRLVVHRNPRANQFFYRQTQILKDKIRTIEEKLKNLKEQYKIIELDDERSILLKQKADLQADLNQSFSAQKQTQKKVNHLKRQLKNTPEKISQSEEVDHNPLIIDNLKARLVELQLEEKKLLNKYSDNNRYVVEVREEIQMVVEKLSTSVMVRHGKTQIGMNPTYQRLQEEYLSNQVELQSLNAKIKAQEQQLKQYEEKLNNQNQSEQILTELQNELDVHRKNYQLYLTKYEEIRIAGEMDNNKIANVSLLKSAYPPLKPIRPNPLINFALTIGLAVFGGIIVIFLLDYMDDSFERPEEVEDFLNSPVLASVPKDKNWETRIMTKNNVKLLGSMNSGFVK